MGPNQAIEIAVPKGLRVPKDLPARAEIHDVHPAGWMPRWAVKAFSIVMSSPWWTFLVVILAIACVGYADREAQDVSLGYLYILPLSFSAILLSRRVTYALVLICILIHDVFGPPIYHIPGRIRHNLFAFIGFMFVVMILRRFVAQRNALNEVTRRQRDELLKEVELAAEVQRMFLPSTDQNTSSFEVAGAMYPARGVGGDYYDYVVRPDGSLRLVIADVSGKGVAAALLMSATTAAVRLETNEPRKLCEVAQHLNDELYGLHDDGRFITVLLGELDARSHQLKFINCGHNPGLLFRPESSGVEWLGASCTPVGLSEELNCKLEERLLAPSNILTWYTDGVSEASDKNGEEFGTERILEVVRKHSAGTARDICNELYQAVADFTQRDSLHDDLTIMVVKVKDGPVSRSFPIFSD